MHRPNLILADPQKDISRVGIVLWVLLALLVAALVLTYIAVMAR